MGINFGFGVYEDFEGDFLFAYPEKVKGKSWSETEQIIKNHFDEMINYQNKKMVN